MVQHPLEDLNGIGNGAKGVATVLGNVGHAAIGDLEREKKGGRVEDTGKGAVTEVEDTGKHVVAKVQSGAKAGFHSIEETGQKAVEKVEDVGSTIVSGGDRLLLKGLSRVGRKLAKRLSGGPRRYCMPLSILNILSCRQGEGRDCL